MLPDSSGQPLKLVFLCGSLAPGRDGVGDYTRRLAGELIRHGHQASIIALNDPHLQDGLAKQKTVNVKNVHEVQISDGTEVLVLRLSRGIPWSKRMQLAKLYIDSQNPDWLSLQYVPYSFHTKGLPFGLPWRLRKLGRNRKWHVMFHELWVGLGVSRPLKHTILRYFQVNVVKSLLSLLKPTVVQTQSTPYAHLLGKYHPTVELLPLISNIPVLGDRNGNEKQGIVRFAFFGSVHSGWNIKQTVSVIQTIAEFYHKRAVLTAIGEGGGRAPQTWAAFRDLGVEVLETGKLEVSEVSKELLASDFGISASVPDLIQKSSAAVAMFEHGLPVLVTGKPIWGDRFLASIRESCPLAIFGADLYSPLKIERCYTKTHAIDEIAKKFIHSFETSQFR